MSDFSKISENDLWYIAALLQKKRLQKPYLEAPKSGGTTCLTLLVQHMLSSKVANSVANPGSRIRQVMP